jgi:hypothetical protein
MKNPVSAMLFGSLPVVALLRWEVSWRTLLLIGVPILIVQLIEQLSWLKKIEIEWDEWWLWLVGSAAWAATFAFVFGRSSIGFVIRPEDELDSWRWAASAWTVSASIWWGLNRGKSKKGVLAVSYVIFGLTLAWVFAGSASLYTQILCALLLAVCWLTGDLVALYSAGAATAAVSTLQAVLFLDLPAIAGTLLSGVFAWRFEAGQEERMAAFVSGALAFQLLAAKVGFFALEWSCIGLGGRRAARVAAASVSSAA